MDAEDAKLIARARALGNFPGLPNKLCKFCIQPIPLDATVCKFCTRDVCTDAEADALARDFMLRWANEKERDEAAKKKRNIIIGVVLAVAAGIWFLSTKH